MRGDKRNGACHREAVPKIRSIPLDAARVRARMEACGVPGVKELAVIAGVDPANGYRWMTTKAGARRTGPDTPALMRISTALHASPQWLTGQITDEQELADVLARVNAMLGRECGEAFALLARLDAGQRGKAVGILVASVDPVALRISPACPRLPSE